MEIWLNAKEYVPEELPHSTQRTFDYGHLAEIMMFDGIAFPSQDIIIDAWWPHLGVVKDHDRKIEVDTSETEIHDRQREVFLEGFVGHIDGIMRWDGRFYVIDMKTASGYSFDKSIFGDLTLNVFSREYVMQLQAYIEGVNRQGGVQIDGGVLLYYNKVQSRVALRFIDYDKNLVEEGIERLKVSEQEAEPPPDYEWQRGRDIPLRCGYCAQKWNCADTRGLGLDQYEYRGQPKWRVK
jgi:hypothetical protein